MRRPAALGLFVAVVWILITLSHGGFWRPDGGSDLHGYYLARYMHVARSWRAFHVPLWDPWEFCGTTFFGSTQSGVLYPPVAAIFGAFEPWAALQVFWLFHAAVFAIAAMRYLGRLGIEVLPAAVGTFVALVAIGRGVGGLTQPNFFAGVAWVPVLLLLVDDATRPGDLRAVALVALAAAAQWASGYPDLALDTSVLLVVYVTLRGWKGWPARMTALGFGLGLGAALAGVLLVPLWETVGQSVRVVEGESYPAARAIFAVQSPADLWHGVVSRYGVPAALLGVVGAVVPSRRRWPWIGGFAFALFALNPPLSALYRLPPFSGLRLPIGWGYLGPVFAGGLIAAGLHWTLRHPTVGVRRIGGVLAAIAVANAVLLCATRPRTRPISRPSEEAVAHKAQVLQALRERFHAPRVLASDGFVTGMALRHKLPSPAGNDPLVPRLVDELLARVHFHLGQNPRWPLLARNRDLLALLGAGLVVVPEEWAPSFEASGFSMVSAELTGERVMYRAAVPRVRLVHQVVHVPDAAASLEQVTTHAADAPRSCVVADDESVPPLASPPAGALESVALAVDEPEELVIDVSAATPALLVVTDAYFPGWSATVDGRATPILRADHAFRAVAVPPGAHQMRFRYSPASMWTGLWISAGAAVVVVVLLGLPFARMGMHRGGVAVKTPVP